MLRPYQQAAVDAALDFWKGSADPILIDAATGAGKSHIIAAVAEKIHGKTGKRVLCLAPSGELVQQNRAKYVAAGYSASTFSASAGGKDTRHPVVFGTPLTVRNKISRFQIGGDKRLCPGDCGRMPRHNAHDSRDHRCHAACQSILCACLA